MIWTVAFWKGAGERLLKTLAQVLAAQIGTEAVGITSLDWPQMVAITATAGVLSLLTSIGNADFTSGKPPAPPAASAVFPDAV